VEKLLKRRNVLYGLVLIDWKHVPVYDSRGDQSDRSVSKYCISKRTQAK